MAMQEIGRDLDIVMADTQLTQSGIYLVRGGPLIYIFEVHFWSGFEFLFEFDVKLMWIWIAVGICEGPFSGQL